MTIILLTIIIVILVIAIIGICCICGVCVTCCCRYCIKRRKRKIGVDAPFFDCFCCRCFANCFTNCRAIICGPEHPDLEIGVPPPNPLHPTGFFANCYSDCNGCFDSCCGEPGYSPVNTHGVYSPMGPKGLFTQCKLCCCCCWWCCKHHVNNEDSYQPAYEEVYLPEGHRFKRAPCNHTGVVQHQPTCNTVTEFGQRCNGAKVCRDQHHSCKNTSAPQKRANYESLPTYSYQTPFAPEFYNSLKSSAPIGHD